MIQHLNLKILVKALFAIVLSLSTVAAAGQWTTPQRLTQDSAYSGYPAVSMNGRALHVVWHKLLDINYEIYYIRSDDGGNSWTTEKRLTTLKGDSRFPTIAEDAGGMLHVAWQDNHYGELSRNYEIMYMNSPDNGQTWSAPKRLTDAKRQSERPHLVAVGDKVLLFWQDNHEGTFDIYMMEITNSGSNFSTPVQLSAKPNYPLDPDTSLPQQPPSIFPRAAVNGNTVIVTWQDCRHDREPLRRPFPDNWEIYYRKSTDGGKNWESETRLTDVADRSTNPEIAFLPGDKPFFIWQDDRLKEESELFYRIDLNATDQRLTDANDYSHYPRVAVTNSELHVLWHDSRDDLNFTWQLYHTVSTDFGETWEQSKKLTDSPAFAGFPAVTTDGSKVYCVYMDNRNNDNSRDRQYNFDLYFIRYEP